MFGRKEDRELGTKFKLGDLNDERTDGRIWRNCAFLFVGKCDYKIIFGDMETLYWRVKWIRQLRKQVPFF